jgi:YjbE family integral membrane protein
MDPLPSVEFWLALGQIAAASLLLAGDNAVVIALAARRFPEARRQAARRTGSIAAVALRIALCPLAAWLLALPLAGLAAGLLLAWTALRLLMPERAGPFAAGGTARGVLPFILMADIVVAAASAVAIAGVARGNALLIALGLLVSIPLIAAGGRIVLAVLPRTPMLLAAGAGLLGWIAGGIIARDAALAGLPLAPSPAAILPPAVALLVVALGTWLARRAGRHPGPIIDLAPRDLQ